MNTAFSLAYPPHRTLLGQIFRPAVEPRAYLRAIHLLLMFPLGVAYFVFFVTAFSIGGALIWTLVGPPLLLLTMAASLYLGDIEAWLVNLVTGSDIRRPPKVLEGVTSFRQKVWARAIDPSTWTGLLYEFAQFPVGVASFVLVITGFAFSGSLILAPLIVALSDEPLWPEDVFNGLVIDQWTEALPFVPLGLVGWLISLHAIKVFSATHAIWARLMLGSRGRRAPAQDLDEATPPSPPQVPIALLPPVEPDAVETVPEAASSTDEKPEGEEGRSSGASASALPAIEEPALAIDPHPVLDQLTAREREVMLLLARGYSNADICETCYISEGTVKTHVGNILAKLGVRDRTQVVVFAYEAGMVRPEYVMNGRNTASIAARSM